MARIEIPSYRPEEEGINTYYLVRALRAVLDTRETELLELKGPCSRKWCRLHASHAGPCANFRGSARTDHKGIIKE